MLCIIKREGETEECAPGGLQTEAAVHSGEDCPLLDLPGTGPQTDQGTQDWHSIRPFHTTDFRENYLESFQESYLGKIPGK